MAKAKPSLPLAELRLLAWRLGIKLGSAIDWHRQARLHLRQQAATTAKATTKQDIRLPMALANEVALMADFEACVKLAASIGMTLAPLAGDEKCRALFYRANKLKPEEIDWIPSYLATVDQRVEAAYDEFLRHLRQRGEATGALFDLAVRASMCVTSPDDPANLSRLAATAEIPEKLVGPLADALTAKAEPETRRKEVARSDKAVERHLLDRLTGEAADFG